MLKKAAVLSLATYFLHVTTWEGHIFHKPAEWLRARLPEGALKPLFDCPICMTPYYSVLMLMLEKGGRKALVRAAMTIGAAAGISAVLAVLSKLYSVLITVEEDLEAGVLGKDGFSPSEVDELFAGLDRRLRVLEGEVQPIQPSGLVGLPQEDPDKWTITFTPKEGL